MAIWSRVHGGSGDVETIITSYGHTVRFIDQQVVLGDAIAALKPTTKRQSVGTIYQLLANTRRWDHVVGGYGIKSSRGSRFVVDETTFTEMYEFLVFVWYNSHFKCGKNSQDVDSRIYHQILEGFKWRGKRWFKPFEIAI